MEICGDAWRCVEMRGDAWRCVHLNSERTTTPAGMFANDRVSTYSRGHTLTASRTAEKSETSASCQGSMRAAVREGGGRPRCRGMAHLPEEHAGGGGDARAQLVEDGARVRVGDATDDRLDLLLDL